MYYVVYGLLYLFSLLPLPVLYLFSDLAYVLVYYVTNYRRDVVMSNLLLVFPDKSDEERKTIAKKFYRNFCDHFLEMLKLISASEKFIHRHFTGDYFVFDKLHEQGKKCQLLLAHNFNWEIANLAVADKVKQKFLVVYSPIRSKILGRIFFKMRTKTGAILLSSREMKNAIYPYRDDDYLLALVADQTPSNLFKAGWYDFFGRPTPFIKGPERAARTGNIPTLFFKLVKIKRGHYHFEYLLSEEDPHSLPEGELTRRYVQYLKQLLRENPEVWLWTHRRWKHEWKPEYGEVKKT